MSIEYYRIPLRSKQTIYGTEVFLPEGGKILIDEWLFHLWQTADSQNINEFLTSWAEKDNQDILLAGLCCLAEAGLLRRKLQIEHVAPSHSQCTNSSFQGPLVSVIIVTYHGKGWLSTLLPSLFGQAYYPIEIIVVDNGPKEENLSVWLKENYPTVIILSPDQQLSFAMANNLAARSAKGEYFLFLNQDTLLEKDAIAQAIQLAQKDPKVAAVALKLRLLWARSFLNGLGNCVEDRSWGFDVGFGELDLGQFDRVEELPSACFAAALVPRQSWEQIGSLDEKFPLYYEDTEWCYRARLMGYKIVAASNAIVYHAFGGAVPEKPSMLSFQKLMNACYGRLRFATKLVTYPLVGRFLLNYIKEDIYGMIKAIAGLNLRMYVAYLLGWLRYIKQLPEIIESRRQLYQKLLHVNPIIFESHCEKINVTNNGIPCLSRQLITNHYLQLIKNGRTKPMPEFSYPHRKPSLLIVSNDIVDTKMAGPGMRYTEMAQALSSDLRVSLAIPNSTTITFPNVQVLTYRENVPESLYVLIDNHDFALISGYMIRKFPSIKRTHTSLIVDLYDPFILENLYYYSDQPIDEQVELNRQSTLVINDLAKVGDFFICGHERQRDLWLGLLIANGRVNPLTYREDETLQNLIDIVGIGIPSRKPKNHPILRGIHPQFEQDSKIVLWGGGIWNWLDPLLLIKAWSNILKHLPQSRLVFLGTRHPNPNVPEHKIAAESIELAEQIGEKDKTIFFIDWIDYEDRSALLCESDVGVILHPYHLETRYSIRTRVMDYFWCHLPVVSTEGDITSEWVEKYHVGRTVPPGNEEKLSEAILEVLTTPKQHWERGFQEIHRQMSWDIQVTPLRQFCLSKKYAADRRKNRDLEEEENYMWVPEPQSKFKEALLIYATQGWKPLLKKVMTHLRWLLFHEG